MTNAKLDSPIQDGTRRVPEPRELIAYIFRFATTFDRFTGQMRRAFSLNAHERLALAMLWERGPMTMTELGAWIPLSRAAVTTLVDRMEASGLVVRGTDPVDRRRTVVRHTQSSEDRMRPIIGPWSDDMIELAEKHADNWPAISAFIDDFRARTGAHAQRLCDMSDQTLHEIARTTPTEIG